MIDALERLRSLPGRNVMPGGRLQLRLVDLVLMTWFTLLTARMILRPILVGLKDPLGMDAVIYTEAARTLLRGGDPWRVEVFDIAFAAPPPSLLPYLPLTVLPDAVVAILGIAVALACAIYALRALRLPLWWLLFPPTALGIAAGSSTLPMLALLVRGGIVGEAAAVVARVYAAVPLAGNWRWRSLALAAGAFIVTAPFLAWPTYISEREHIAEVLAAQSNGGGSATAIVWLIPFAIAFLVLLGRRRAAWLAVPALWPDAQLHYASIAMPVLAEVPLIAMALAVPFAPGLLVAGLGAQAAVERLARRAARRAAPANPASAAPG